MRTTAVWVLGLSLLVGAGTLRWVDLNAAVMAVGAMWAALGLYADLRGLGD